MKLGQQNQITILDGTYNFSIFRNLCLVTILHTQHCTCVKEIDINIGHDVNYIEII